MKTTVEVKVEKSEVQQGSVQSPGDSESSQKDDSENYKDTSKAQKNVPPPPQRSPGFLHSEISMCTCTCNLYIHTYIRFCNYITVQYMLFHVIV